MAWLHIAGEDGSERAVALDERTLRVGRSADSDIVLSDASKSVSRTHAELRCEQGRYVIVDLESQNGTWINGERVQRAEIPVDGEITIGTFRLTRKRGQPPDASSIGSQTQVSSPPAGWPDVVIRRATDASPRSSIRPSAPPERSSKVLAGVAILLGAIAIGAVTWRFVGGSTGATIPTAPVSQAVAPPAVATPSEIPQPPADPPAAAPPQAGDGAADPVAPARQPAARTAPARRPLATQPPVPRKPGESAEAWRNRIAALEARYDYSKAALDRGDFGSAASGFEAILRSEPGFGDAPDLLVQARAGLRASATQLMSAGRRLEAAGDWIGALQQYERAREIDAGAPGLDAAEKHVREQLRAAGREALNRGIELERLGHAAEALQEFTKALQWLPADDSSIPVARAHADRLRLLKKD